eukprot:2816675-Rhodomonas_salina.4
MWHCSPSRRALGARCARVRGVTLRCVLVVAGNTGQLPFLKPQVSIPEDHDRGQQRCVVRH